MASEASRLLAHYLHHPSSAARLENLPDRVLIERFALQRDEESFAALVRRHGSMVLRVCQRVLHDTHAAEDAFQATFLVFSRKAASLRCADSVGCFLHGVAYRLAQNARKQRARRRMHESRAAVEKHADDPLTELSVREAQALVDEELARLPEKYRAPVVLCCLEGRTRDEAARQLGWTVNLVKSRLEQGRERLRARLSRRGLTLPAAMVATLLAEEAAPALSAALMRAAVRAAMASPGTAVSTPIALLAESVLGGAASVKAKVVVGLLLLTGVLAAGVGTFAPPQPAKQAETPSAAKAPEPAKSEKQRHPRTDPFGDPLPSRAVARIGTVRWWFGRGQGPLVYAPDGKSLVFRDDKGTVRVLDAADGKELRHIDIPDDRGGYCFALAPNGKTAATAGYRSPTIRLWDVRNRKELRRIEGDKRGIDALAFSRDGKTFAAGMYPGIRLWDCATGKEIRRIAGKDVGHINGIFFLPDGKTLISGDRQSINWWDIATGREVRRINRMKDGKSGSFYHLAVSSDGKRVAAIHSTNLLLLWDAGTGKELRRVEVAPQFTGACLCFSPDNRTLVCGNGLGKGGNQTVFFAAATGEELRRWDEGNSHTRQLAFSPDGKILAQAMPDFIRLRDAKTGKPAVPKRGLPDYVMGVRFSGDGKALIAGCYEGRTGTWNPLTGEPLTPLRDPPEGLGRGPNMLLGPTLTAHGEWAALANPKGVLHVWAPATGKVRCRIAEPPVGGDQADFSADGKVVAVKHKDHIIRLWDATTGKLLRSLPRKEEIRFPHPHAFSPEGRLLATASVLQDHRIRLWDAATAEEKGRFAWQDNTTPTCLIFSPNGEYLLAAHGQPPMVGAGRTDNSLRLWSLASKRERRRFPVTVPSDDIRALAISSDGKTVAAAAHDAILLWELASGAERGRFTGHREWIWSLAFSPNGRLLASGSLDCTACVWDVTGICPDGQWLRRTGKPGELERLWSDLGHKDGVRAYRALWRLRPAVLPPFLFWLNASSRSLG